MRTLPKGSGPRRAQKERFGRLGVAWLTLACFVTSTLSPALVWAQPAGQLATENLATENPALSDVEARSISDLEQEIQSLAARTPETDTSPISTANTPPGARQVDPSVLRTPDGV